MCFSAAASFATSAATLAVGIASLLRVKRGREVALAIVPLAFGAQQAAEGFLWLSLGGSQLPVSTALVTNVFAVFALVLWPVLSPIATVLVEPNRRRRLAIMALLAIGSAVAVYGLRGISAAPYTACAVGHSLSYDNGHPYLNFAMAAYIASTCLPPLLSSHRTVLTFGLLVAAGLIVSTFMYFAALFSVWCFFAAAGSVAILRFFYARQRESAVQTAASGLQRTL
jgi:hypothetical protein